MTSVVPSKSLRTPTGASPLALVLTAPSAEVTIITDRAATEATAHVSGPEKVLAGLTERRDGNRWIISLPDTPNTTTFVSRSGRSTSMVVGNISAGSIVMSGRDIHISPGGAVSGGTATTVEPVRVTVTLPEQSSLLVSLKNGILRTRGVVAEVTFRGANASVDIEQAALVDAETSNGHVTVGAASRAIEATADNGHVTVSSTAPRTSARSTNGHVTVSVSGPHQVRARTSNGNVTVLRNGHHAARVEASTVNGCEVVR